jgi:hypothetical protein
MSTEVPFKIMKLLLDPANAKYTQEDYEKALYKSIKEEKRKRGSRPLGFVACGLYSLGT